MTGPEMNALVILGGIALFTMVIAVLDLLAQRKRRRQREHRRSA